MTHEVTGPAITVGETLPTKTLKSIAISELVGMQRDEGERSPLERAHINLEVLDRIVQIQTVSDYLQRTEKSIRVVRGRGRGYQFDIYIAPWETRLIRKISGGGFSDGQLTRGVLDCDWASRKRDYIEKLGAVTPEQLIGRVRSRL